MSKQQKVAFITGSSRGIGAAIAKELAQKGIKVVLNGLEKSEVYAVEKEILAQGGRALSLPGDITSFDFLNSVFTSIPQHWGSIDILINNAGMEIRKPSLEYTEQDYDRIMGVNLKAAFFLSKKVLPAMIAQQWGRIINISSIHQHKPKGIASIYSMSKAGMWMMTRELATEYAQYGITINSVAPGAIRTEMNRAVLSDPSYEQIVINKIPARQIGEGEDVAKLVAFLCSDEASYINGSSHCVDGGLGL